MEREPYDRDEENTARLIGAALGPDARPSPAARTRALAQLLSESRRLHAATFPDRALALLIGALALMTAWIVVQGTGPALSVANGNGEQGAMLVVVAAVLAVNLVMVPVAGAVIILRRRHV